MAHLKRGARVEIVHNSHHTIYNLKARLWPPHGLHDQSGKTTWQLDFSTKDLEIHEKISRRTIEAAKNDATRIIEDKMKAIVKQRCGSGAKITFIDLEWRGTR